MAKAPTEPETRGQTRFQTAPSTTSQVGQTCLFLTTTVHPNGFPSSVGMNAAIHENRAMLEILAGHATLER